MDGANVFYTAGNAGNGANPQPDGVILGAGAQILTPSTVGEYQQNPGTPTRWFEVTQVNPTGLNLKPTDLDSMLSGRPLLLSGSDGHTAWVNSAALLAAQMLATTDEALHERLSAWRAARTEEVMEQELPA